MARGPKQRKLRKRRRTGEENRPDPALLDTNNERHLAAAEMARRSFEDQPRGPDGRWVEGKLVTLPEPRGDLSGSTTTNLSWAIEGTGVVGEVDPVTLMQPFVHPHDRRTETVVQVKVPIREFVERVTPEVEGPVSFIDEMEKEVRQQRFRRLVPQIALLLFLSCAIGMILVAAYFQHY